MVTGCEPDGTSRSMPEIGVVGLNENTPWLLAASAGRVMSSRARTVRAKAGSAGVLTIVNGVVLVVPARVAGNVQDTGKVSRLACASAAAHQASSRPAPTSFTRYPIWGAPGTNA